MVLDVAAIISAVQSAEEAALDEVADFIAEDARSRAPIRKVFKEAKGFRRKFRPLTSPEKALAIKRAVAYYGPGTFKARAVAANIANYGRAELRRPGSANALVRSRTLRHLGTISGGRFSARVDAVRFGRGYQSASLHPLLTARGRYEVSSGRAIHHAVTDAGDVRVQIGGALKASIGQEGVVVQGDGATVDISARIRYAKFVEFPTTHNAAQPFLLPALHDSRARLRSALARELRSKLGGR